MHVIAKWWDLSWVTLCCHLKILAEFFEKPLNRITENSPWFVALTYSFCIDLACLEGWCRPDKACLQSLQRREWHYLVKGSFAYILRDPGETSRKNFFWVSLVLMKVIGYSPGIEWTCRRENSFNEPLMFWSLRCYCVVPPTRKTKFSESHGLTPCQMFFLKLCIRVFGNLQSTRVALWATISDWEAQSQAAIKVCFLAVRWGCVGLGSGDQLCIFGRGGGRARLWEQCGIWHLSVGSACFLVLLLIVEFPTALDCWRGLKCHCHFLILRPLKGLVLERVQPEFNPSILSHNPPLLNMV